MQISIFKIILLTVLVEMAVGQCPASGKIEYGLTQADKDIIVNEHNKYRLAIANGQHGQPAGVNLRRMKWNAALAAAAQDWANQCQFKHNTVSIPEFQAVGQNLAWTGSTADQRGANFAYAIKMWFDEVDNFIFPNGTKNTSKAIGHYTQIVWANTDNVGCGYAYYKDPVYYVKLYVCNYGPAGNYINQAPYLLASQTTIRCPNLC